MNDHETVIDYSKQLAKSTKKSIKTNRYIINNPDEIDVNEKKTDLAEDMQNLEKLYGYKKKQEAKKAHNLAKPTKVTHIASTMSMELDNIIKHKMRK